MDKLLYKHGHEYLHSGLAHLGELEMISLLTSRP